MNDGKIRLNSLEVLGSGANRRQYRCRFVRAGGVRAAGNRDSRMFLEPQALEHNAGLFSGKAVFIDHAGLWEGPSLRSLAGVTSQAEWNAQAQSIDGVITLYSQAEGVAGLLDELLADGERGPDIGLSIVFWPVYEGEAQVGERRIVDIHHVESVDLVFEPAADGRVLQALSRLGVSVHENGSNHQQEEDVMESGQMNVDGGRQVQAWEAGLARTAGAAMIAASGLPTASRERLAQAEYSHPDQVERAIQSERDYLASLAADKVIQVGRNAPRGGHIQVGMSGLERLQAAAEAMFNGVQPPAGVAPLTGIRELYLHLSGDYEMTGVFHADRIQFANVDTTSMANMVADLLNKRIVNEFIQYPRWWEAVVNMEDFASLQQVKWITLGGVGELPTVSEGAVYTELSWDDMKESASFVKKGGYLGITLEAIDKDDTRRLQAAPRALAQAAWLSLSKAVSYIFTQSSGAGPTMSDSLALFHASHGNLGSTALSLTSWAAARLAMRKQTELNSGERLGALTAPRYLLVPPDLEVAALQALASPEDFAYSLSNGQAAPANVFTEGNELNARMAYARSRVIVVDLWTDSNDWAAAADPMLWPIIGLGFRYGRTPEIFSVASPTAGLLFTNDTMPVKVRFYFAVGPVDYRGLYKANVA